MSYYPPGNYYGSNKNNKKNKSPGPNRQSKYSNRSKSPSNYYQYGNTGQRNYGQQPGYNQYPNQPTNQNYGYTGYGQPNQGYNQNYGQTYQPPANNYGNYQPQGGYNQDCHGYNNHSKPQGGPARFKDDINKISKNLNESLPKDDNAFTYKNDQHSGNQKFFNYDQKPSHKPSYGNQGHYNQNGKHFEYIGNYYYKNSNN